MFLDSITTSQTETYHIRQHRESRKHACTKSHRLSEPDLAICDKKKVLVSAILCTLPRRYAAFFKDDALVSFIQTRQPPEDSPFDPRATMTTPPNRHKAGVLCATKERIQLYAICILWQHERGTSARAPSVLPHLSRTESLPLFVQSRTSPCEHFLFILIFAVSLIMVIH